MKIETPCEKIAQWNQQIDFLEYDVKSYEIEIEQSKGLGYDNYISILTKNRNSLQGKISYYRTLIRKELEKLKT